jgi:hypothetical protein
MLSDYKYCIGGMRMNSVGIDVSKGKSMIAVMRPFGELVVPPFEIHHTDSELCELAKLLRSLPGETRVVMEATGTLWKPRVITIFQ